MNKILKMLVRYVSIIVNMISLVLICCDTSNCSNDGVHRLCPADFDKSILPVIANIWFYRRQSTTGNASPSRPNRVHCTYRWSGLMIV